MRFYAWNYDTGEVAEYLRLGECNKCGECCRVTVNITIAGVDLSPKDGGTCIPKELEQGIWSQADCYGRSRYWQLEIKDNEEELDFNCFDHVRSVCKDGAYEKGILCSIWPLHPDHIAAFNNCSFSFIKLHSWPIEEEVELEKIEEIKENEKV